jgi:hypothetical protein
MSFLTKKLPLRVHQRSPCEGRVMRRLLTSNIAKATLLLLVGISAVVLVEAIGLFQQVFPSVTINPPPPVLVNNCSGNALTPNPTSVNATSAGASGTIRFTCGTNSAFTINHAGVVAPVFTLPFQYTSLSIVVSGGDCSGQSVIQLTSGQSITFAGTDRYKGFDYCAPFNAPTQTSGSLGSFNISWSQTQP